MREIKFRGKVKYNGNHKFSGEWIYGYYRNNEKENAFITEVLDEIGNFIFEETEIDEHTLGQYTGLKDKNDTEIYEGDIILTQPYRDKPFSSKAKEKRLKGIVFYNIKCGKNFVHDSDKLKYWGAKWNIEIIDKEAYKKYSYCSWGSFFECEVIGNIYDNPELLGE